MSPLGRSRAGAERFRCALALALARQMVRAGGAALPHSDRSVSAVSAGDDRRRRRHFVHRTVSAPALRLQCRGPALVVATDELPIPDEQHRQVPAFHARVATGLPGRSRGRLPRKPHEPGRAGEVVATGTASDTALLGDGAAAADAVRRRALWLLFTGTITRACSTFCWAWFGGATGWPYTSR